MEYVMADVSQPFTATVEIFITGGRLRTRLKLRAFLETFLLFPNLLRSNVF